MTRRKLAQRDIMQSYIENEQKEFVPPEPQFVPVEKQSRKTCYNKTRNKESEKRERKKRDALRKRFVNLEQEGDANGLKARGIQKIILVNLAGGLPSP